MRNDYVAMDTGIRIERLRHDEDDTLTGLLVGIPISSALWVVLAVFTAVLWMAVTQ